MTIHENMITITFGDVAENHVGMQKVGEEAEIGFTRSNLELFQSHFEAQGYKCELVNLASPMVETTDTAFILVVKAGVKAYTDTDILYNSLSNLDWDKKAKMRGRVVNKRARWNLVFGEESQEPNYDDNKGRIVAWSDVPVLQEIRDSLELISDTAKGLYAEGNYYYDLAKCGIGYHGDAERKKVVAIRLYQDPSVIKPIFFQWYYQSDPVGDRIEIPLAHGDLYIMSQKATGNDWKRRIIPTLRHSTGSDKYTEVKKIILDTNVDMAELQLLNKLTVVVLKQLLKSKGLKVGGRKAELINRLLTSS